MVWHIFKKDLRLLWPLVVMVAMLQFASAGISVALGNFGDPRQLMLIADVLSGATLLGSAILVISAVHQDTIPGVNQDWLVRPIRRGDLMLAKLLFLLLAVQLPMVIADVMRSLFSGLPAGETMFAVLLRSAVVFLTFDLPIAALATVTANATEAIGTMLAIWLFVVAALIIGSIIRGGAPPFSGTGMQWMVPAYWSLLALAAAAVIIPLQYFRRATGVARRVVIGAAVLAPMLSYSSWASAFALQQWFSNDPAAARPIMISFDPDSKFGFAEGPASGGSISLPLKVKGIAAGDIIRDDRSIIHIISSDGKTLYVGPTVNPAGGVDDFPVRPANGGEIKIYQLISLPAPVLQAVRGRQVRIEIDYSLTLLHLEVANAIAAINGDKHMSGFGRCKTRIDAEGDDVVVGCLKTGRAPDCVSGTLQNRLNGERNPEDYLCRPDYSPLSVPYLDAVRQYEGELEYRDPKGLAKYPVDEAQVQNADVVLRSYRPRAHFTRRLVIPNIRIGA